MCTLTDKERSKQPCSKSSLSGREGGVVVLQKHFQYLFACSSVSIISRYKWSGQQVKMSQ